jgi:glycerol-3-phosphate cytidylyltransferase
MARKTVITFGTFDIFHVGHFNLLKRASLLGNRLVVGVSSDAFSKRKKKQSPYYNFSLRSEIILSLKFVDKVFKEDSMEKKRHYIKKYGADILVMGDDWKGKFDDLSDVCQVVYLKRTESISSTLIKKLMQLS